jgi:hypothetical protein
MDAGVLMAAFDKSKFDDGGDADRLTLEFAVGMYALKPGIPPRLPSP